MENLNWIKSEITYFLIKNYGYTRCELTPKIQKIVKLQKGSELDNLFTDIQLILSIPIEFIPEDVYIFIGEILDVLDNNKNEINNKYLKNIVVLLDDIPGFEERFTEILKNYNKDNVLIIFTNTIGEIEKEIFEKKKDAVMAQLSQSGQLSKSSSPKLNQNTIQKYKKTSLFKSLGKSNSTSRKHNYEHNQQLEVKDLIKDDKSSLFNSLPTTKQTVKQSDKPKNLFTSSRKTNMNPLGNSNGIGQSKISTISLQNNPESQQIQVITKIKQEKKEQKILKEQMKSKKLYPLRMQLIPDEQLSIQMTLKKERKEEKEEDKKKEIKEELMGLSEDLSDTIEEFDDVSQKSSRSKSPDDDR